MNFEARFSRLESALASVSNDLALARTEYAKANDFTTKLLYECGEVGIKEVAIGVADKSVPESMEFVFGARGNIFAMGRDKSGWPSIWGCVDRAGIASSCGNSNQKQINDESQVVDGVYHLRDGKWAKVR